jgi:D-proline reductase (dithiol) PrdB
VGLAARAIEASGISTITLSLLPAFTRVVGAPRVAGLAYPFGRPLGQPGDAAGQMAVVRSALRALELIDRPGGAMQLPFTWPEPPARARGTLPQPPPIARLIQRKPWLLLKFISGDVPG